MLAWSDTGSVSLPGRRRPCPAMEERLVSKYFECIPCRSNDSVEIEDIDGQDEARRRDRDVGAAGVGGEPGQRIRGLLAWPFPLGTPVSRPGYDNSPRPVGPGAELCRHFCRCTGALQTI